MLHPAYPDFRRDIMSAGVDVRFVSGTVLSALATTLSSVLFIVVLLVLCVVVLRSAVQTHTLKAVRARDNGVTFDNVRGMSETKDEVRFAVEQLQHLSALKAVGARPVKGLLFEGPPGTGKTLIAKAIAGEAGVPLISASGSDFIEMFVGVGAARIRRLWQQAEESAPCVLFIDEIDAVGRQRGSNASLSENNQTINALLQRMDGLGTRGDVLVIGATNRREDIDPALLRPGRFDRIVHVGPPLTQADREDICDLYLSKLNLAEDVTVEKVARLVRGMTGADIAQCLNDAALLAAREARDRVRVATHAQRGDAGEICPVTIFHIDAAITRHLLGGVATVHASERDREIAAVHEAGHAIVRLSAGMNVLKVSITPYTTGAGGITQADTDEAQFLSDYELRGRLRFILGGLAAEDIVFGSHTTGVADDLKKASELALQYVNCFGMDSLLNEQAIHDKVGFRGVTEGKLSEAEGVLRAEVTNARNVCAECREKLDLLASRLLNETTVLNLTPKFLADARD
jgi:cell division protease FtsH